MDGVTSVSQATLTMPRFQISLAVLTSTRGLNWLAATMAIIVLFGASARSQPAPDRPTQCTSDVMLVLDASGSMSASDFPEGAPNRMHRVQLALARVVPRVENVRRLGLIVYGPGESERSCRNIELKLTPSPAAGRTILDIAEQVRPAGRTPIARSVEMAVDALKSSPRPAEIVVLTDGEDTCRGDPCGLARQITAEGTGITIHVVGFRLPVISGSTGARCLADETGGMFVTAETTDELTDALLQTLGCPEISHADDPPLRDIAARGR